MQHFSCCNKIVLDKSGGAVYICSMKDAVIISVKLREAATISAGYPLRISTEALDNGDVAFIQLKNVDPETGIDWSSVDEVELPSGRKHRWLREQDIIFASRGVRNFAYPIIGARKHTVCSPHFYVLGVKDVDALHPEFLAWQINQTPAQHYFKVTAVGTQAVMTIRRQAMEELPILVPPIREQMTIVEFWRAAQKERAALSQLIETNSQLSSAIAYGLHQRLKGTNS